MVRVVRCSVMLAVSCVAFAVSSAAAGSANPVLTDSARSVVAGEIARSQVAQPSSAAAREARVRSRTAFRGLSPAQARQTLLARHPSVASRPGWLAFPSLSPAAAGKPAGPYVLRVDGGDRPDSLVVTSEPVAFRDRAGDLREIDLGLERAGEDLVTRGSPVGLRLPETLDEAISVGVGDRRFSIMPDVSNGSGAVVEGYAAFYGEVDSDTDFVAKPVVGGVETFSILRSPVSPEQLRFRISDGAGSELRPDRAGGFVLWQGEEDLARVSAPLAWDAQHRPVPVETTVDGEDLVLQVAHRDRDVAYPIVVDPTTTLSMCWHYISLASGCHVDLWETSTDPKFAAGIPGWAYEGDGRFAQYAGSGGLGTGLYIRNLINNYFNQNEAGDWYYRAPPGVRIHQAMFSNLTQDNNSNNTSCLFVGVLSNTGNWEPNAPRTFCAQQTYDAVWTWLPTGNLYSTRGGTEGNAAIFGAMAQRTGWSSYWMDHMGGVAIALQEMSHGYLAPWINATDFPDNWQTDPNRFITFHAGDLGLGIRSITFSSPENPGWQPVDYDTGAAANKVYDWCTGGARLTCPREVWMKLKIGNLRQGFSTIRATVTDMVGKTYTYEHPIAIQYYWASAQYGGANGAVDTASEVDAVVDAMAATNTAGRQALWAGLDSGSQGHYVNDLLPYARQARQGFALSSSDAATRTVFSDPTTHGTIAEYGTPMTTADLAFVSDEGPPSWVNDGAPAPDVLASTYNVSTDDGPAGPDSTGNRGCDPSTETGCPDSATTSTTTLTTPSDPATDDLDAVAATESSEDAVAAGARSGGFDRYGARADADAHALSPRTGLYEPFGDSDCTNFVSQAWHLGGGLPMKRGWRIRPIRGLGLGARSYTRSWTLVRDFVDYMVNQRQTSRLITADVTSFNLPSQAAIADAIEYDWGEGHGWSHLAVAVKTHTNIDNISQHSLNRRQSLWNLGWVNQRDSSIRARMKARVVHLRAP